MKTKNIIISAVIAGLLFTALFFAACGGSTLPGDENLTPVTGDFDIDGDWSQVAGSVTGITVQAMSGKTTGTISVWYTGTDGTVYAKSGDVPQDAGKYLVTFDVSAAAGWNAVNDLAAGTLTVTQAGSPLVITPPGVKAWGDAAFDLVTTGGSGEGAVTFSITAGSGVISISGSTVTILSAGNAEVTAAQGTQTSQPLPITIDTAQLIVTADNKTINAGDTLPAFTYGITGFVNNETNIVVSGAPQFSCAYNESNSVHDESYSITVAQGTLTADNYHFSFVNGTLTVIIPSTTKTFTFVVDDFPVYDDQGTNVFKVGSDEGVDVITLNTGGAVTIELIGDGMSDFVWYIMGTIPLGNDNTVTLDAGSFPTPGTYELTVEFNKDSKPWLGRIVIQVQ